MNYHKDGHHMVKDVNQYNCLTSVLQRDNKLLGKFSLDLE